MNPLAMLGKPFEQVKDLFPNSGMLEVYDLLEEGDEQEYYVAGLDHSWEFLLDKCNVVKTVFLYVAAGYQEFDGIGQLTRRDEILKKYGVPSKSGEEKEVSILGKKGAWERYDYSDHVMHIEHSVGMDTVQKITLMLPSVAP
ncbi:hypothetical protein [Pseudomonas abyssi]|uniref:hypothetical protein n=1 Tax=Pseudomonas abyssi TaxID=170540 RepID=UPI0039BAE4B1